MWKPPPSSVVSCMKPTSMVKAPVCAAKAGEANSKVAASVATIIFTFLNVPPSGYVVCLKIDLWSHNLPDITP